MPPSLTPQILDAARILWNYLKLDQQPEKSDCLIAMGSHDLRVAQHAAELMLAGWAPLLVCSGGQGRLTKGIWQESEASKFAAIAQAAGVPLESILLETRSTNTGENILFSKALLDERGIPIRSALLVHKPYMERRAYATALNYWSGVVIRVASPLLAFEAYPTHEIPMSMVINTMLGDFQRVRVYPEKGFQVFQDIPADAIQAYEYLRNAGFSHDFAVE